MIKKNVLSYITGKSVDIHKNRRSLPRTENESKIASGKTQVDLVLINTLKASKTQSCLKANLTLQHLDKGKKKITLWKIHLFGRKGTCGVEEERKFESKSSHSKYSKAKQDTQTHRNTHTHKHKTS